MSIWGVCVCVCMYVYVGVSYTHGDQEARQC